jgi:polyhydroxyalkanoate synthase
VDRLVLFGYCMGGLFALMHASVHADARVAALVTVGSPIDAHKMGAVGWLARVGHQPIAFVSRQLGNVPGPVSSAVFRMTNPVKSATRYGELLRNSWNDDYVLGFDATTAWTNNFVAYPGEAFRELMQHFMRGNKLKDGCWRCGDTTADLRTIRCPVLGFAGESDRIVPVAAARDIVAAVGSEDVTFVTAPGGHMGVFAGRHAPERVWQVSLAWLRDRVP